jgi:hypothetical protein
MQSQQQTICANEPTTPSIPGHSQPNNGYSGTELILAVAVLIRSVAVLIQVIGQLKERNS